MAMAILEWLSRRGGGRQRGPCSSRPRGCRGAGHDSGAPASYPGAQTLPRASPNCRMWPWVCRQLRRRPALFPKKSLTTAGSSQSVPRLVWQVLLAHCPSQGRDTQLLWGSATTEPPALGCNTQHPLQHTPLPREGEPSGQHHILSEQRLKKIILMF